MNSKNSRNLSTKKTVSTEAIQKRAYELFIKRGQEPGHEMEDWLQAETEISFVGGRQKAEAVGA